jgi:hypothetical protein
MSAALAAAVALWTTACAIPGLPGLPAPGVPAAEPGGSDHSHGEPAGTPIRPEDARDCFTRHLREAITLNTRRADTYAGWSGGASRSVSRRLIRTERVALAAGWLVDRRARRFQRAGIPIGCAEFVSMALTPPLPRERPSAPPRPYEPRVDAAALRNSAVAAYGVGGFPAVERLADRGIRGLADEPRYHCMTRHLLESIRRVARLAPEHAAAARRNGLPSTVPLSELMLRLHLAALPGGADLDRQAGPIQQEGVPILCRDVPPIP